jgi:hypothetical protein
MRELRESRVRCAKHFIAGASSEAGRADAEKLLAARWFDDPDQRKLVEQALAKLAPPQPPPATAPAAPRPDPALAEAQSRARACYPKGKLGRAMAKSSLDVSVVIAQGGAVTDLKLDAPGRAGKALRACLFKAFKGLSFAAGDQRTVEIALTPPD